MALNDPRTHAPDLPGENPHYVRAVTEFGEQAEVLAAEDIYASNGMKLVAKGARIGRHQFEHLTNHKLAAPLDHSLCTDKPVDVAGLALEAGKFIEQHPIYRRIAMRAGDPLAVKHALCSLKLPAPIQVRLSVMRARRTEMYEHSLRTAMVAFALARRLRLPEREHGPLLLACLCHDIGEMHTDPAILAVGHSICPEERRFVHVHPITSYVLVHELPGFSPAAAQAILHHHERLDGSGYPNDLPGPRIPALARLVAVADVAEAVIKRFDLPRLDMLFRLNQGRFDPGVVGALRDLIHVTPEDASVPAHEHGAASQLAHLAELLQAGFDPDNMPSMLAVAREDPAILMELRGMLDEMDWLLTDLANEIDRRAPELAGLSRGALNGLLGHLRPATRA